MVVQTDIDKSLMARAAGVPRRDPERVGVHGKEPVVRASAALLLALLFGNSLPAGCAAATDLATVTIPEVGCLSTLAAIGGGSVGPTVPVRKRITVERADAPALDSLALYVNAAVGPNNTVVPGISVLAPRGWHCSGSEGVDGNAFLTVVPITQACTGRLNGRCDQFSDAPPIRPQSVLLSFLDLGNMVSSLCDWRYFAKSFCPIAPVAGHPAAYPGETVEVTGRWRIGYEDPPGVHGHGSASGGWNPDDGVVVFVPPPPSYKVAGKTYKAGPPGSRDYFYEGSAYQSDCTLPARERVWCSAILNDVLENATY